MQLEFGRVEIAFKVNKCQQVQRFCVVGGCYAARRAKNEIVMAYCPWKTKNEIEMGKVHQFLSG